MKNKKLKRPGSNKKKFVKLAAIVLLIVTGVFLYTKQRSNNNELTQTTDQKPSETINLAPANEEEKQQGSDEKQSTASGGDGGSSSGAAPSASNLTVTITSADASTIRAQVSGVVEDGGTCTAVFTQGSKSYMKKSSGLENVSYTQCEPIRPDAGKLTSGTWKVVVKYDSSKGSGTSAESTITV